MRGITAWFGPALAMVLPACFAVSISHAADMVPWVDDLATAQQMAAAQNQLILVHFYSDDCAPCRRLENNVFNRPGFGHSVAQNYVPVRVNATVSPDLARRFRVDRWPTDLLLTSRGEEMHRMVSPQDMNEYLRILNQVAWRVQTLPAGMPIQQASQGFANDRPQSASAGVGSPYQLVSQPVGDPTTGIANRNNIQTMNQPLPQYALNDSPTGISYGPATMNPVAPNASGGQVATNPFAPPSGATQQYATNHPGYPISRADPNGPPPGSFANTPNDAARQQYEIAQQQVTLAQQYASSPQVVENQFIASPATRPGPHAPVTNAPVTNSPALNSPAINSPSINSPSINSPSINSTAIHSPVIHSPVIHSPVIHSPVIQPPTAPGRPASSVANDVAQFTSVPSSAMGQFVNGPSQSAPLLSAPVLSAPATSIASATAAPPAEPAWQSPSPPSQKQPSTESGLEGYCPVTLIDQDRWVRGDKRWGARHRGRLYLFQSAAAQQKFLAAPDQYSPALAGFDPVVFAERGQYAEGLRNHGIRYQDQIFMFVSEESLARFTEAPTRYAEIVRQAVGANRQLR